MRRLRLAHLSSIFALSLLVAACGGDDGASEEPTEQGGSAGAAGSGGASGKAGSGGTAGTGGAGGAAGKAGSGGTAGAGGSAGTAGAAGASGASGAAGSAGVAGSAGAAGGAGASGAAGAGGAPPVCVVGDASSCGTGFTCKDVNGAVACVPSCDLSMPTACGPGLLCKPAGTGGAECVPGCLLDNPATCANGEVCEQVQGGEPRCFAPVQIVGIVEDADTKVGIGGARVAARDEGGAVAGNVAVTLPNGTYALTLNALRAPDGHPISTIYTLRADAEGYQTFPGGLRPALPIDLAQAVFDSGAGGSGGSSGSGGAAGASGAAGTGGASGASGASGGSGASGASGSGGAGGSSGAAGASGSAGAAGSSGGPATAGTWVLKNSTTTIDLFPIADTSMLGTIRGKVTSDKPGGTMVDAKGVTGIADTTGEFAIFNVPSGAVTVAGYDAGVQLSTADVTVPAKGEVTGVTLSPINKPTATFSGTVNLVNANGIPSTSVVLAVEDTFIPNLEIGEVPKGLRASNVSNAFSISGIPDGKYVVLASLDNDGLVRDPDPNIAGTQILHITVTNGVASSSSANFKVTGALEVFSPGANGVDTVSGTPTFEWADDSSEDMYELRVFDSLGTTVWENLAVPAVKGSSKVSVDYGGPALQSGVIYQFRATSMKMGAPISRTEELRGVFLYK